VTKAPKGGLLGAGARLSLLTLASRILGLVREMTKAAFLGTTPLADAFGIAFMIPNLFRRLFAENSISVAFIPTFMAHLKEEGEGSTPPKHQETLAFVSAVFTVVTFLTTLVVALGIAASPALAQLFASPTDPLAADTTRELALLTRLMFPYLLFISVAAFYQGILNTLKVFTPSGFTPILFNLFVIGGTYVLSPRLANPARAMAVGVLVGGLVQAAFQFPFVRRLHWAVGFVGLRRAFTNPGLRTVLRRIAPTVVGMAAYQLNDLVSTALAGRAGAGSGAGLQYSLRLQELLLGVFAVSIGTVILPDLAGLAQKHDWAAFNAMLATSVKIIALITIPVTFFSLVGGESVIVAVYQGRRFDARSVALTHGVFRWHIAGLFFIAANRIISPAFYALGNTRLPTLAGILSFGVNILLACLLVRPFSGPGIAAALSLASAANTVLLVLFLRQLPTSTPTTNKQLAVRNEEWKRGTTPTQSRKDAKKPGLHCSLLTAHCSFVSVVVYIGKITLLSIGAAIVLRFARSPLLGLLAFLPYRLAHLAFLVVGALIFAALGLIPLYLTGDPLVHRKK
jgi:putative peptidoglycan lipid II flippase